VAVLSVLDKLKGDKRVQWDKGNEQDVEKAKKLFDEKKKEGFMAWGYKKGLENPFLLHEFDEDCDRIVMTPPPIGG